MAKISNIKACCIIHFIHLTSACHHPGIPCGSRTLAISLFLVVALHVFVNTVDVLKDDICTLFDEVTL